MKLSLKGGNGGQNFIFLKTLSYFQTYYFLICSQLSIITTITNDIKRINNQFVEKAFACCRVVS